MARLPRPSFVRVCADGAETIPARMSSPRPTAACPGQRTTWAEISISKTKHLPPQALSGANIRARKRRFGSGEISIWIALGP